MVAKKRTKAGPAPKSRRRNPDAPRAAAIAQNDGTSIVTDLAAATKLGEHVVVVPGKAHVFSGYRDLKIGVLKSITRDIAMVEFELEDTSTMTRVDRKKNYLVRVLGRVTPVPF